MKPGKKLKLTTRGRYAVMAMVELGQRDARDPVPLLEIADSGNISLSYLEQLFAGLRRNGLVKSYRGPGGGYVLARAPSAIMVSDILDSAEDCAPAMRSARGNGRGSEPAVNRQTQDLWNHIGGILYASLSHVTLEDVISGQLSSHHTLNKLFEVLSAEAV